MTQIKQFSLILLLLSFMAAFLPAKVSAEDLKVALILDKGGKDDKSFNAAAYEGVMKAKKDFGISLKYVEATDDAAFETTMRSFAKKDFSLIIGVGFAQAEAVKKISAQFPQIRFAIIDAEVVGNNVRSLLFEEHQGSFLMGAIAALFSKNGKVGFIGGMDVPLIRRFEMGYIAGAKYINPKAEIASNYIGVTGEAWNNPAKAKELAFSQYSNKIEVIFAAAGASNNGVFDAAEEKKKFAIGVDSNQNWVKPGIILTSMLKRVDVAVYELIKEIKAGKFVGGVERFGMKNAGIDYALDQYNEKLFSADKKKKIEQIKIALIKGKIFVPDYYKKNEKR